MNGDCAADRAYAQQRSGIAGAAALGYDPQRNAAPRPPSAEPIFHAACRAIDEEIVGPARTAENRLAEILARLRGSVPSEVNKTNDSLPNGMAERMARSLAEGKNHISQIHYLLSELEKFV